ncbi:MAG: aminoacyl-tRNA hydrolase [Candidatus Gastranaerophilales bacterium]|nr:aminoacyl-tRNA hydrolase [Candidatus Gastranaerophilales bacterium]
MKLITALGNPSEKYANTRHNIGFMVADELSRKYNFSFKFEKKFNAEIAKTNIEGESVVVCKPQTFMNLSGEAVRPVLEYFKLTSDDLFLIYDDISLDLGKVRFRAKGSDGGHNGVKSVIQYVKTDKFDRLKVGIGPQPQFMKSEVFVLSNFTNEQKELLEATIKFSAEAVEEYFKNGIQIAQNKYN